MMDRRQLLKGIIVGASGMALDTLGVKLARPEDVAMLKYQGSEVIIGSPLPPIAPLPDVSLARDLFIEVDGHFHHVGFVTSVNVYVPSMEVTAHGDNARQFIHGLPRIDGTWTGIVGGRIV